MSRRPLPESRRTFSGAVGSGRLAGSNPGPRSSTWMRRSRLPLANVSSTSCEGSLRLPCTMALMTASRTASATSSAAPGSRPAASPIFSATAWASSTRRTSLGRTSLTEVLAPISPHHARTRPTAAPEPSRDGGGASIPGRASSVNDRGGFDEAPARGLGASSGGTLAVRKTECRPPSSPVRSSAGPPTPR